LDWLIFAWWHVVCFNSTTTFSNLNSSIDCTGACTWLFTPTNILHLVSALSNLLPILTQPTMPHDTPGQIANVLINAPCRPIWPACSTVLPTRNR
jgi:hypothetical protein